MPLLLTSTSVIVISHPLPLFPVQLKKGALLSDFDSLVNNVRNVKAAFKHNEEAVNEDLSGMKLEVQTLLAELEHSYYSSQHRGRLVTAGVSEELKELCQLATECDKQA